MTANDYALKVSRYAMIYNVIKNVTVVVLAGFLCSHFESLWGLLSLVGLIMGNATPITNFNDIHVGNLNERG
ncbi:hypothetical protein [Hydrogenovibrio marinus]|uniref:Uncharacterized protein n=1 Tax=Hydrogenovibrio marinus TaxID=28885 RepID=A0A066ZWI5_HYDMR|nr:hypothetical protein [Hydrogenovibrio marinus]KDN94676.1 hypothetical protein EI16_12315 [Hydrogenovibrio marinus]